MFFKYVCVCVKGNLLSPNKQVLNYNKPPLLRFTGYSGDSVSVSSQLTIFLYNLEIISFFKDGRAKC